MPSTTATSRRVPAWMRDPAITAVLPPLTTQTAWEVGEWPLRFGTEAEARAFAAKVGDDDVREVAA